jgi:hypothetical protein
VIWDWPWWLWALVGAGVWALLGPALGVIIGRSIHLADERADEGRADA